MNTRQEKKCLAEVFRKITLGIEGGMEGNHYLLRIGSMKYMESVYIILIKIFKRKKKVMY